MVFQVKWSERARLDLVQVRDYIAADNPTAARKVIREIVARTRLLATQPFSSPTYKPARDNDVRHTFSGRYRIFYRVHPADSRVEILTIWHSSRREPRLPRN